MSLRIGRQLHFRYSIPTQKQLLLSVAALVVAVSSLLSLPARQAHADVPVYSQESPGFGDQRTVLSASGLAFDSAGNFFVSAASGNDSFIRKFAADGTFLQDIQAASPTIAYSADYGRMAVDSSNNLYAINKNNNDIHVFNSSGIYQTAIAGAFSNADIVFDHSDNYYLTDTASQRVRKFAHDGTWLYDIGGPTSGSTDGKFNTPGEIAVDSNNNLVAIDKGNNRIQIFNSSGTFVRKFGQKNTGVLCPTQPSLGFMAGLTLDTSDNIYIATHDTWCTNLVQKFTIGGSYIETQSRPNATSYMRLGAGNLIYDLEGGPGTSAKITRYDTSGATVGSPVIGNTNVLIQPKGVVQDAQGNTYIGDSNYDHINKYDSNRSLITTFGSSGSGNGQFQSITGLAIDKVNGFIYVSDSVANKVQKFTTAGTYVSQFSTTFGGGDGQFSYGPMTMIMRTDGNLLIQDGPSGRLQTLTPTGTYVSQFPDSYVYSFAQKSDGTIVVHSGYNSPVLNYYNTSNSLINSHSESLYNNDTGIMFTPSHGYGYTLAYDSYDNLYAIGHESNRNQYYRGSLARLNFDNPDLPPFTIINQAIDDFSDLYITPSNQLFSTDSSRNIVRVFTPTGIVQPPSAPLNFTATSPQASSISASWQEPASGTPIAKYRLEYKPHSLNQWVKYGTSTGLSATLTGLLDDTYDVRVTALNDAGAGTATEVDNITVTSGYGYKESYSSSDTIRPAGIAFDSNGNRYESDPDNSRVTVYSSNGSFVRSLGEGQLQNPAQLAISSEGKLYVPDKGDDTVKVFALDGTYLSTFGGSGTGDGQMNGPDQVVIDKNDNIYVISIYSNIQKYDKNGNFLGRIATDLTSPTALAVDQTGNLYVANNNYDTTGGVIKYDSNGVRIGTIIDYGWDEGDSKVSDIYTIHVNGRGELVMNDAYAYRIKIFSPAGQLIDAYGRGYSSTQEYMMFDDPPFSAQAPNGDVYIPSYYTPFTQVLNYVASATPPANPTAPSVPQNVAADTSTANQATLSWGAPVDNGGAAISTYSLEYKLSSSSTWIPITVTAPATSQTLTSLAAGQYDARMSATNSAGTSATTAVVNFTVTNPNAPASAPTSPQNLTVTSPTPNSLTASWQVPASDGGSTLTQYTLEYKLSSSNTWNPVVITAPSTGHTLTNVPAGSYDVRITATNAIGTSPASNIVTIAIASPSAPAPTPAPVMVVPGVSGGVSPNNPHLVASTTADTPPQTTPLPASDQPVQAVPGSQPGRATISWHEPQGKSPTGYVIEYRTADIPQNDTTTPWRYAATTGAGSRNAVIALPAGDYNVRVAALLPGDNTRIIVGVAHITIAAADFPAVAPATPQTSRWPLWATVCIGLVAAALLGLIPFLIWKRKRRKQQAQANLPPRWQ